VDLLAALGGAAVSTDKLSRAELAWQDGIAIFRGEVALGPHFYGGDIAAIRSASAPYDASGEDGLMLSARGDGRRYLLRLTTSDSFFGVRYEAELAPSTEWQDIALPFSAFRSVTDWRTLPGHPPLDPAKLRTVGLAVYREAGPFRLDLAALRGYRDPSQMRPKNEPWDRWIDAVAFPLALEAAGLPAGMGAGEVFAAAEERRSSARIACYEESAEIRCESLLAVRAALSAERHGASPLVAQAIVFLAMEAGYEQAIAADLVADTWNAGVPPPRDFLDREAAADRVFARWEALDARIEESLEQAGLELTEPDA
jgi:NADH dehydrogenase [ubiquinone] 1 alpha subcomplex assembly factor 1